jgi:general secretion pathway protein D
MEVAIYEISRNDLLQIGNQLGSQSTLEALGGIQPSTIVSGRSAALIPGAIALHSPLGFLIPASSISLFNSKTNTRLLFSTQVHAFDDEKSSTRVGSKVPVQTASVYNGITNTSGTGGNNGGVGNVFGGSGYPVIQYEDVGLNLDFKPKVYPNQDVQVSMTIESKDVAAGPDPLTPTFTQRKVEGVARIPNGKTMLIASIAQDRQTDGRAGLPLISFLPIIGRLFTAPNRNNQQADIVITMTPRVLRAPEILPADEESRPTGTMQTPQAESLEAMVIQADKEDQYARLRTLPTNQNMQLPTQAATTDEVTFVPAPKALVETAAAAPVPTSTATGATSAPAVNVSTTGEAPPPIPRPAFVSNALNKSATDVTATNTATTNTATTNNAAPSNVTADTASVPTADANAVPATSATAAANNSAPVESRAELLLLPEQPEAKVGERRRVMVFLKTDAPLGLATATLRFDPRALAVRSVSQGVLSTDNAAAPMLTQSVDASKGVLIVSVAPASGAQPLTGEGLLLIIEVEALAPGDAVLQFDADKLHLIATDGRTVSPKANVGRIKVTQ